ncbi:MAG TPA: ABC transporter substrate-binding protein, partial [Afipia sp.]|nr:ABC transporter substrate-binding protein [Afipia sp.]
MKPASALGFLLAAGVAGLTFGSAAHAQQTVKIGSVLSVTGPASFLGEPEDKTLRMYVEKINAAGGINGK